jgi:hypothetical protein
MMNDNSQLKINRTVFNAVVAPLIVAAVLGLVGWGWWLHAGHAEQEKHLTKHDDEIATLQRDSDRVMAKLDEILRKLQTQK